VPVAAVGNGALASVIEHFGPLVRRAERDRFSQDGQISGEVHEKLIALLEAGEAEPAATVAFDIWHSLPADSV